MSQEERWMEHRTDENGKPQFVLVTELDGWSFLDARRRGEEVRSERILDLNNARDRTLFKQYKSQATL